MTRRGEDSASARWRRLAGDRLAEYERLSPDAAPVRAGFWDRRADRYAASMKKAASIDRDPFLRRLRRVTSPTSTAIDVGAGSGRFAIALAAEIGHVTAVDPSARMLEILEDDARDRGVTNLTTVTATWEEARTPPADVAFSAFVLPLVPDAGPFLAKLDAAAREHALLYLGAFSGDAVLDPLWRHFHGERRSAGPSFLDALAVLRELGIEPRVDAVEIPNRRRFETVEEATDFYREALLLEDTDDIRAELADLLRSWLLGRRGALRSPLRTVPAAIFQWRPAAARG